MSSSNTPHGVTSGTVNDIYNAPINAAIVGGQGNFNVVVNNPPQGKSLFLCIPS
jgi:hypothetical protein